MFWKPSVNLLVRIRVGGVSFVGIVFMNEGIVAPLSLFHTEKKEENDCPWEQLQTNTGRMQLAVLCSACSQKWGAALHIKQSKHSGLRTEAVAGTLRRRVGRSWELRRKSWDEENGGRIRPRAIKS